MNTQEEARNYGRWEARRTADKRSAATSTTNVVLDLSHRENLTSETVKNAVSQIEKKRSAGLHSLHLSYVQLKLESQAIFPSSLTRLWLSGTKIDENLESRLNLDRVTSLKWLYLNGCGLKKVPRLPKHLEVLFLSRNELSIRTLDVPSLRRLEQLQDLALHDNMDLPRRFQLRYTAQSDLQLLYTGLSEYQRLQEAVFCFLACKRFRATSCDFMFWLPQEIITVIAHHMWDTRVNDWPPRTRLRWRNK